MTHPPSHPTPIPSSKHQQVRGPRCVNRAMDGDVVALEILPRAQWVGAGASSQVTGQQEKAAEKEEGEEGEGGREAGYEGLMPNPVAEAETAAAAAPGEGVALRPTGRVVGVVRRNWRVYCGTLQVGLGGGGSGGMGWGWMELALDVKEWRGWMCVNGAQTDPQPTPNFCLRACLHPHQPTPPLACSHASTPQHITPH